MDPGETPVETAIRETQEEVGVQIRVGALLGAMGGPEYEVEYPNGDKVAYVVMAYDAAITGGLPVADGDETTEVGWFKQSDLSSADLNVLVKALLRDLQLIDH